MFRVHLMLGVLFAISALGGVLFLAAGRWDLPFFWVYLGMSITLGLAAQLTLDPDLLRERMRPGPGGRDNLPLLRAGLGAAYLAHWVVAGLDVGRFHWSTVPVGLQVLGLAGVAGVMAVWYWAMRVNRFFSAAVRIQRDRGHHVITDGPYRFVRHPGYAAILGLPLWSGLALGSYWSMLPGLIWTIAFIRRAAREDRMLQAELSGYREYAARVRYRLVPGVW